MSRADDAPLHERLRGAAAHRAAAQGTLLEQQAVPGLLPMAGVGAIFGLGLAAGHWGVEGLLSG